MLVIRLPSSNVVRTLALFTTLAIAVVGAPPRVSAQRGDLEDIPPALKPWVGWVLHGIEREAPCTRLEGETSGAECAWPGILQLDVTDEGGRFEQTWELLVESWVPLPGEPRHRPVDVRVDGRAVVPVLRDGVPSLRLGPGTHRLQGRFFWKRIPTSLPIPVATGIVRLRVRGEPVDLPRREEDGDLWLDQDNEEGEDASSGDGGETAAEALRIIVHRKLVDDVPFLVETRIELHVSGQAREELLRPVLLPGTQPLRVETPLPARLEDDGLRVQVRPGEWTLTVVGRTNQRVESLTLPSTPGTAWPRSEVWVLQPNPAHREVEARGAPAVDPEQTLLPDEWKALRAWRVDAGQTLQLEQRRRGAEGRKQADTLTLERELWLDFDGGGGTFRDVLRGTVGERSRIEVLPAIQLGNVRLDGDEGPELLISQLPGGRPGVEIREREVHLVGRGRIEGSVGNLPAVGWDVEPRSVSTTVHLPPGWYAWGVFGADSMGPREAIWLESWDLFEMFVLLLLTVAAWRLWGAGAAGLVFAVVLLTHPVGFTSAWWIPWFVLEAIRRALPQGVFRRLFTWMEGVWVVVVLLAAVGFGIDQVRAALHPALEKESASISDWHLPVPGGMAAKEAAPAPEPAPAPRGAAPEGRHVARRPMPARRAAEGKALEELIGSRDADSLGYGGLGLRGPLAYEVDPDAAVQTGPGLPSWRWRSLHLSWNGPVAPTHRIRLWLTPPWLSSLIGYLRVVLLGLLLWWLVRGSLARSRRSGASASPGSVTASAAAAAMLLGSLLLPSGQALAVPPLAPAGSPEEAAPSDELLQELKRRLLEPPVCAPNCVGFERMRLQLRPDGVAVALELGALSPSAVPLPVDLEQWQPATVLLDGRPASGLLRRADEQLWLRLPEGRHEVRLAGPVPPSGELEFPFDTEPALVEVDARGWLVEGLRPDGSLDGTLTATRVLASPDTTNAASEDQTDAPEEQGPRVTVPPFVRVTRHVKLGLRWTVVTRVERLSPPGRAIPVRVKALPGERVTSETARLEGGEVHAQLAPDAEETTWTSVLEPRAQLQLQTADSPLYVEAWTLDVSSVWHVTFEGPPPLHRQSETTLRQWKPWPGETLRIDVVRPESAGGATTTVDLARIDVIPGIRSTDVTLWAHIRTSRGGPFRMRIAKDAHIGHVKVGSEEVPVTFKDGTLSLELAPGDVSLEVAWREPRPISALFRTPKIRFDVPLTNVHVRVQPGRDRWILWASGPRLGPAVLFWSLLLVLIVVAVLLGRWRWTPVRTGSWLLLLVGLSQVSVLAAAVVVGWLLFVHRRQLFDGEGPLGGLTRPLSRFFLLPWTVIVLGILVYAIHQGLLGTPEMQVEGYNSSTYDLVWYLDRSGPAFPQPGVYSVPMLVYRLTMLAWALWLSFAVLRWLRVAWNAFSEDGGWAWVKETIGPRKPARTAAGTPTRGGLAAPGAVPPAGGQGATPVGTETPDDATQADEEPPGSSSSPTGPDPSAPAPNSSSPGAKQPTDTPPETPRDDHAADGEGPPGSSTPGAKTGETTEAQPGDEASREDGEAPDGAKD